MARRGNKTIYEDTDSLFHHVQRDKEEWALWGELAESQWKQLPELTDGHGAPAKSFKDSRRNCPRCQGILYGLEVTENGYDLLKCNSCRKTVYLQDIDAWNYEEKQGRIEEDRINGGDGNWIEPSDAIYRQISQQDINRYIEIGKQRSSWSQGGN